MEDPSLENMTVKKGQVFSQVLFAVSEEIIEGLTSQSLILLQGEGTNLQRGSMLHDDEGGGEELTFIAYHVCGSVLISTFHE